MKKFKTVKTFGNRIEAEIAKGKLTASNIDSIIFADDAGGMYPFQLGSKGVELRVEEKDVEKAEKVLRE